MFYLRKEWQDPEEGIETAVLHWTTTRVDQEPNWKRAHPTTVLLPQPPSFSTLRSCSVWVAPPFSYTRFLSAESAETQRFLLHFFCEVIQRGRTWSTEPTRQEMRAEQITYSDLSGDYTQAILYYSLDGLAHVNRLPMFLEGIPSKYQRLPSLPERQAGNAEYKAWARRSHMVARLPVPHVFRGQLWGPVGTRALYSIHLRREGLNPFTDGGFWLLREGTLWEVQL
jgi:hypothetical protein